MIAPLRYPLATYRAAAFAAFGQVGRNNISLIAAGVAFFSMLSLFPALAALIAVLSLIADPAVVVMQLEQFKGLMPADVYDILNAQIVGLVSTSSDKLGWAGGISLFLALWSARAGTGAVMQGLNAVYGKEGRATWRHYVRALFLTVSLVSVGVVALLMVVVVPVALAFLPLGPVAGFTLQVLRWTIALAVIFAGIGLLYRYGPNRSGIPIGWVTPGAVFSVLAWAAVSITFSYYVSHFGNYNEVYGSIGAVIAMLVWLWISTFIVLVGAALNAELELRREAALQGPPAPEPVETDNISEE
ncbi:YihY/virulence factor BrkB family protein [uncultured Roseobacter sp.]|uniref:YihY/virulence factor BrkB family protein n=1 Tax=uncultured Roseobacter sp. TaxID=114847 RepID=UPI00262ADF47|nr:YihY/virulence factor BrkB family protein [uncultured Roseobacter sp.]